MRKVKRKIPPEERLLRELYGMDRKVNDYETILSCKCGKYASERWHSIFLMDGMVCDNCGTTLMLTEIHWI